MVTIPIKDVKDEYRNHELWDVAHLSDERKDDLRFMLDGGARVENDSYVISDMQAKSIYKSFKQIDLIKDFNFREYELVRFPGSPDFFIRDKVNGKLARIQYVDDKVPE